MEILRVPAPVVLFSAKDAAGRNIVSRLGKVIKLSDSALYLQKLETSPSFAIVASRHSSKSGTPTLTCHSTGNFGPAEAGGNPRELGIAPALYLRQALLNLKKNPPAGYEISLEVTHHGPSSLPFPIMFVEVGST
ncbi:MAG: D-aminoacyl-tRNA deacylase, partial [Candidatus Altiarchaeales archaeon]|nr:D-aminoacyl-tRNA deacylase [Candidatus Altiarchaeales archaeon]